MSLKVNIDLQGRDFATLCGLFECRVMTAGHIAKLYFGGKSEYTKKRLQKLKGAGLIAERQRQVNKPSIHFLTRKAFAILEAQERLANYPTLGVRTFEGRANVSELTLRHELEVMDVKTAFHDALAKSEKFSILTFNTWPLLYQFEARHAGQNREVLVKPDGFIRIHEKEPGTKGFYHECFLEVDRSTEIQDALVAKASCYLDYYKSGGYAVRHGGSRTEPAKFPFRVLIVLKSAERRNNTAERLVQHNPPILRQTWLTTLAELTADPLGPIWILPGDYRDATTDTPYYRERPNRRFEYRRQPERELIVESKIKKCRLLENPATPSFVPTPEGLSGV